MGDRINTVMQPCFFHLSGVLPADEAIAQIKRSVEAAYGKRGRRLVERNFAAIDRSLAELHRVDDPGRGDEPTADGPHHPRRRPRLRQAGHRPAAGRRRRPAAGERLPVDGTFPSGTARYEKRAIAEEIPIWDPDICIDCGQCAIVCPHAAIRMKVFTARGGGRRRDEFPSKPFRSKDLADHRLTIQVAPDDCTGCGVCVDVCPAKSKTEVRHKAINMEPVAEHRDARAPPVGLLPVDPAARPVAPAPRLGQGLAGARAAVRVLGRLRRLRRDALPQAGHPALRRPHDRGQRHRLLVDLRRQPADHAVDGRTRTVAGRRGTTRCSRTTPSSASACASASTPSTSWPACCSPGWPRSSATSWSTAILDNPQDDRGPGRRAAPPGGAAPRPALAAPSRATLAADARRLLAVADNLVRQGVWIIGGDGWAYDIGFGGLDHVLSSGRNVNILVLDTEVYSNTGGQASKATPARGGGQVRGGGQEHRQEGPRRHRPRLRRRLRRPDRDGRQRAADHEGAARGRRLAGPVAGHRLQHVHRPRHRHVEVDEPPEGRGEERLLAAVPLPPERDRRRPAVQARLAPAVDPGARLRGHRGPLRHPRAHPPRPGPRAGRSSCRPTSTSAGATTSSSPPCTAPSPTSPAPTCSPRSRTTPATATTPEAQP